MSTHKHIDRICCLALAAAVALTLLLYACAARRGAAAPAALGYEARLFDTTRVHTIDIVLDDWDGFLQNAEAEEYTACAVVIDGEASRNIGIRAKGNTSLTQVAHSGSSRYSFKLEFDHYEAGKTWHGLDKLSLNNLIQDNTCMKDYLVYRLMAGFGAAAPLCSYAWLTVNGEDWGLYLAVEGIENSFLARNYGADAGDLYKPDSAEAGGGRGNGRGFSMGDFVPQTAHNEAPDQANSAAPQPPQMGGALPEGEPPQMGGTLPEGEPAQAGEVPPEGEPAQAGGTLPEGEPPQMGGALPEGEPAQESGALSEGEPPQMGGTLPDGALPQGRGGLRPGGGPNGAVGRGFARGEGGGMGSADVRLQYIDDDPASYPNIFDNAKTTVTTADEARLIAAFKTLDGPTPTDALDADAVLRYFVVHNFVCNDDSYTGQMIHNYYLYEQDGRLAMLPWDYNLAFGGFGAGSAQSTVNTAIDDALTDRPMQCWIFADETATAQYHALYADFLAQWFDDGALAALVEQTQALIAPYVQKDPSAFCTYEQFTAGAAALRQFCALRAQSVQGQLDGSIPATTAAQQQAPQTLVAADGLELAAMGSMGMGRAALR